SLLLILADQGKLALDDPIEKYLPEFRGILLHGKAPPRPPTVRQLLCNMSGLPGDLGVSLRGSRDFQGNDKGNGAGGPRRPTGRNRSLNDSVKRLAEAGLQTEPGAEFHYATMGFNVAARVAEVAAKKPFEDLVRAELLEPLGMNRTRYSPMGL